MEKHQKLVRDIQTKTKENQAQLATRFDVTQPTISRWLKGIPPELHHAERIEKEARRLQIGNQKPSLNMTAVPIVGYVGAGGTIAFGDGQGPHGEADMPPKGAGPGLVAVIVKGDSMSGMLEDGWTVYYDSRRDPPDETMHGKLCIVGLTDDRVLIKTLLPGSRRNHYHLQSTNAGVLLDQPVAWAARIKWIAPK